MIEQISNYFSIEMIYLWLNIGVIPLWFILIFFPNSKTFEYFVGSIIPFLILGGVYTYFLYYFYINDYNFTQNFKLYLGLSALINLFSDKSFLIMFWVHFLAINLFCGAWIVSDSLKFSMSKFLVFFPLLITYFIGPIGLFIYWLIRIFFAKKLSLYD